MFAVGTVCPPVPLAFASTLGPAQARRKCTSFLPVHQLLKAELAPMLPRLCTYGASTRAVQAKAYPTMGHLCCASKSVPYHGALVLCKQKHTLPWGTCAVQAKAYPHHSTRALQAKAHPTMALVLCKQKRTQPWHPSCASKSVPHHSTRALQAKTYPTMALVLCKQKRTPTMALELCKQKCTPTMASRADFLPSPPQCIP